MEDDTTVSLTVRLPVDLIQFVEGQAKAQCNSKAGIVKFALTKLREGLEPGTVVDADAMPQPVETAA